MAKQVPEATIPSHSVPRTAEQITATANPEVRRDLADQLIAELVRHSVAEEMYVYPAMTTSVRTERRTVPQSRRPPAYASSTGSATG
jgi:spore coat protein CotF